MAGAETDHWLWDHPVMLRIDGILEHTRNLDLDPLWLSVFVFLLAIHYLRRLPATKVERERPIRGHYYLGRITPKSYKRFMENARRLRSLRKERNLRLRGARFGSDVDDQLSDAEPDAPEQRQD